MKINLEKALAGEPIILLLPHNNRMTKCYLHERRFDQRGWIVEYNNGIFPITQGELTKRAVGMWGEHPVFEHWGLLSDNIRAINKFGNDDWHCVLKDGKVIPMPLRADLLPSVSCDQFVTIKRPHDK